MRFDSGGEGVFTDWFVVVQISGDNLRDQAVKSFIATGKMTAPKFSIYRFGPGKNIDVAAMEEGTGSATGKRKLPSTSDVQRCDRRTVNVPGAMNHTCRLEGIYDGNGIKDQIHEILYELCDQGVRR